LIRMIWVNSKHYKSRERLTGLFRKVSNEIIHRCCKEISLDKLFDGYVKSSTRSLHQSIDCCIAWKETYTYVRQMHHKFSSEGWVLDQSSIFAQVDAFVQRCKDLLEVCECQIHFARWEDGNKTSLPCFAGQRGPEITRSLLEIESAFDKNLAVLSGVKKTILDVKATTWHDDYNRFRAGIKDLEVMMQNVISTAFETINTVEQGVELLDAFQHLSSREAIRRTIDKKTVEVYALFNDELNSVKKELTKKCASLGPLLPKYAGQAHWARSLKGRIDRSMKVLDKAYFLPHIGTGAETRTQYNQLSTALDEFIRKTFNEWAVTVDKDCMKLLDVPLMCRSAEKQAMLDMNFDKVLLKLFNEIQYWEKLMFEIPHYATEVYLKREELRNLRENVLLVVRDYNRIIAALSLEERGLFRERIRHLDKKIHPGLTKLTWASKGISDFFLGECRQYASKVQVIVDDYKIANLTISRNCKRISETLLVRIDSKKVYEGLEFEEEQMKHRASAQTKLKLIHEDIVNIMKQTYEVFRSDGQEVSKFLVTKQPCFVSLLLQPKSLKLYYMCHYHLVIISTILYSILSSLSCLVLLA
jgi:dynein heavy chain